MAERAHDQDHDAVLAALRGLKFFQDIATADLEELVPVARLGDHPAGGVIFREGQSHDHVFFVVEGTVGLLLRVSGWRSAGSRRSGPANCSGGPPRSGRRRCRPRPRRSLHAGRRD
ncbi:MAG: hypothetical protein U0835_15200 [Isosphaeraceae bacterium]